MLKKIFTPFLFLCLIAFAGVGCSDEPDDSVLVDRVQGDWQSAYTVLTAYDLDTGKLFWKRVRGSGEQSTLLHFDGRYCDYGIHGGQMSLGTWPVIDGYLILGEDGRKNRIILSGEELILREEMEYEGGQFEPAHCRSIGDIHFVRQGWRVPEMAKSGYSDVELKRKLQGKWALDFGLNWFWKKETRELVRTTGENDIHVLEFRGDGTCFITSSSSDMDGNPWGGECIYTIQRGYLKVPKVGWNLKIGFKGSRLQLFSEMEWSFAESMTRELRFMPDKE